MSLTVSDLRALSVYVRGVVGRAEHHAQGVDQICLAVAGALVWRSDGPFEIRERGGRMRNAMWVEIGGQRYSLSYNHKTTCIDVRRGSLRGPTLASFNNRSSNQAVKTFFASL